MADCLEWFSKNNGIKVHKALRLKYSSIDDPSSGLGLFVDTGKLDMKEMNEKSATELLRIPRCSAISVYSLNNIIGDKTQYSRDEECKRTVERMREANSDFLSFPQAQNIISESLYITLQFLIYELIKEDYEIPKVLKYYMENVLLKTEVGSTLLCNDRMMPLYGQYGSCYVFESIFNVLKSYLADSVREKPCSLTMIRQMFAIVGSRTLEIPREVDPTSGDFTVETTLVPLLDFANHDNIEQNAYFDVDRKTDDILLLLDHLKCKEMQTREIEIYISYSPIEDLMHYSGTYGFIPKTNDGTQFFNISIERDYLKQHPFLDVNLRLFYKWFSINPVIQVLRRGNKWFINDTGQDFAYFLLPFMCLRETPNKSSWEYYDESYKTLSFFHQYARGLDAVDQTILKSYAEDIATQEDCDVDYITLPPLAWTLSFKDESGEMRRGRFTKDEALDIVFSDDNHTFYEAILSFSKFFICYLKERTSKLCQFREDLKDAAPIKNLIDAEISIIRNLTQNGRLSFWTDIAPDSQMNPVSYPKPPLWNPRSAVKPLEPSTKKEAILNMGDLTLNNYNPSKYTDFLTEELYKYRDYF